MTPTILYLIGTPYCGSTILGAVFGQHSQIGNIGELGYWTSKTKDPSLRRCACGNNLRDCEFWSRVREVWFFKANISNEAGYRALQSKFEKTSVITFMNRKSLLRRADFQEYARLTRLLMDSVAEVSGRSIIFDTTKSPGRAVALSAAGLNIMPIHLIRSGPRFIASSINRRVKRKQTEDPNDSAFILQTTLRWIFTNLAAEIISAAIHPQPLRLIYEELVAHPRESISRAGEAIGVDLNHVAEAIASGASFGFDHSVDGSLVRLEGPTSLKPSPEKPLSPRIERVFQPLAGWLAKRYGY